MEKNQVRCIECNQLLDPTDSETVQFKGCIGKPFEHKSCCLKRLNKLLDDYILLEQMAHEVGFTYDVARRFVEWEIEFINSFGH
jgi:hypothetical protein